MILTSSRLNLRRYKLIACKVSELHSWSTRAGMVDRMKGCICYDLPCHRAEARSFFNHISATSWQSQTTLCPNLKLSKVVSD